MSTSTSSATASSALTAIALRVVGDSGTVISTYSLANQRRLTIAQGSVVDFGSPHGAIVNAANEGCISGGGVDGAISSAGGPDLHNDRLKLPRLRGDVRCPTGDAKLTGPGDYGSLRVPFVIHAVGPNYMMFDEDYDVETPHRLLRSAYQSALDCTLDQPDIHAVGFSLLSAGIFRGDQSVGRVLCIGVQAIQDWSREINKEEDKSNLEDVILFAFTDKEARTLQKVCDFVLLDNKGKNKRKIKNSEKENDSENNNETTAEENNNDNENDDKIEDACPPEATEAQDQTTENKAPDNIVNDNEAKVCSTEEKEKEKEKEEEKETKEDDKDEEQSTKEEAVDEKGTQKPESNP